jgi:hypothetical protein
MTIEMGDDEWILYVRKRYPECPLENAEIGRRVWGWLQAHDPGAQEEATDQPCYWASTMPRAPGNLPLPQTATHVSFSADLLPALFAFLDKIGTAG